MGTRSDSMGSVLRTRPRTRIARRRRRVVRPFLRSLRMGFRIRRSLLMGSARFFAGRWGLMIAGVKGVLGDFFGVNGEC